MKILIIKLSSLGDVLHNLPVVWDLRNKYPDAQIDWLVEEGYVHLITPLQTSTGFRGIDRIIPVASRRWKKELLQGYFSKVKFDVYGAALDNNSKEVIAKYQLEKVVIPHGRIENDPVTGKSGRERIMEIMRAADVLLLLHGDYEWCAEYIPSKSYDYFWSGRPIWGVTNRNPQFDQMLLERGAYLSHTMEPETILKTFEQITSDWQAKNLPMRVMQTVTPKDAVKSILQQISK